MNTLQSSMLKKGKKGFTLTELAIVIAVIAILIAVLVPTFTSVITKARVTAAAEEAKNAISSYMIETNKGLNDGTCVAVDDTYYFKVSGNTVSTDSDSYLTSNSAVSGLCPYQWDEDGDAYSTYNGKVVVYIDEAVVVFPESYEVKTGVSVSNNGLTVTGSGDTYTVTGTFTATSSEFKTWWGGSDAPNSAFYFKAYIPVAKSSIAKIVTTSSSNTTKTWDSNASSNENNQTISDILIEEDGACYVDWILNGTTTWYKITYYNSSSEELGTITIYNNASQPSS